MANDEHATVAALDTARTVLRIQIESNLGRVIDMAGDSVLAIFETATGAVSAAIDVQRELNNSMPAVPEDRRMRYRIGVHLGDVIEKADGTIYGDGVNIAARLEGLAEPGGVTVSDTIYGAVRGKVRVGFVDQGEQQVKNITYPVRAHRVRPDSTAAAPPMQETKGSLSYALGKIDLSLPDKPSLAVPAFTNMSGDPEQEYFADGVVDDIISALTRVRAFFVIARNSSFTYKGKAVDIKQVGRELGVRYVLEGSIRKAGNRIRITGQLIEAENGRHIWADRFEGNLDDIFELQDRITESVVAAIEPNLKLAEIERPRSKPTANLQAYDLSLRASPNVMRVTTKMANDEALGLLYRAIELDPGYSLAKAMCAFAYVLRKVQRWASAAEVKEGVRLVEEALADHRDDPETLTYVAHSLSYLTSRQEEGIRLIDRALALNPNSTKALQAAGWIHNFVCNASTAIEYFRRALRLNPIDPEMSYVLSGLGIAYLMAEQYEDALSTGLKAIQEAPPWVLSHFVVTISLVQLARMDEAKVAANQIVALMPEATIGVIGRRLPFKDKAFHERKISALRAVGIPE